MLRCINMVYPDTLLEEKLWSEGYEVVVGIDEAGRGPLAGPVVAGAVVISSSDQVVPSVRDSKKMSEKQRELAFDEIMNISDAYGVGVVSNEDIDRLGIQVAVLEAMRMALEVVEKRLAKKADYIIADGLNILCIPNYKMERIKQGDLLHYSIAAGSVLAKVTRDRIMVGFSERYPDYGFDEHMGYGTKKHLEALEKYGVTDIHRRSFRPVSKLL